MIGKVRTCVLNMPMNEGTGNPHDSSGYGNNGTNNGADWVSGDYGWAMDFGGTPDNVNCGSDASLDIEEAITLASWVKTTQNTTGQISGKQDSAYGTGYGIKIVSTKFHTSMKIGGVWKSQTSNIVINNGIWHRCIATYDGSIIRTYVDNVAGLTLAASGDIDISVEDFVVGAGYSATVLSSFYIGYINESHIYNRPWTSTEVTNDWNATKSRYGL